MYTKKVYKAWDMFKWTRFETISFLLFSSIITSSYFFLDLNWLKIPWTPLALIGTAVGLFLVLRTNTAYDRWWEARKIWGGIVNTSRTFGMFIQDMVTNEYCDENIGKKEIKKQIKTLTYRHIAWMVALRHSMRAPKPWETVMNERSNREWSKYIQPPERTSTLEEDLEPYLSKEDMEYTLSKGNFPYPRHFATLNHYFMWVFVWLLPFALVPQFAEIGSEIAQKVPIIGQYFIWLAIPFYVIVAWVFHTMERIGRTGENPFEGSANDVPISTISRGIEIDLRQNLGESLEEIPEQFPVIYDTQM